MAFSCWFDKGTDTVLPDLGISETFQDSDLAEIAWGRSETFGDYDEGFPRQNALFIFLFSFNYNNNIFKKKRIILVIQYHWPSK